MWKWIQKTCNPKGYAIREYNAEVEKSIKEHWIGQPIRMRHLIWERWSAKPEDGSLIDDYNFVIFIDIEGDLDWIINDDYSKTKFNDKAGALIASIEHIESMPCKHLDERIWLTYKTMLGAGILCAMMGDAEGAKEMKNEASRFLEKRTPECSRRWILTTACVYAFILVMALKFVSGSWISSWNFLTSEPFIYGLLGAFIAIARRTGLNELDASSGKALHIIETIVRLSIGMILGKVSSLLLSCPLAPELANDLCSTFAGGCIAAFASGLIDNFIPSMVSTYVVKPLQKEEGE